MLECYILFYCNIYNNIDLLSHETHCFYKIEEDFRGGSKQIGSPVQLYDLEC